MVVVRDLKWVELSAVGSVAKLVVWLVDLRAVLWAAMMVASMADQLVDAWVGVKVVNWAWTKVERKGGWLAALRDEQMAGGRAVLWAVVRVVLLAGSSAGETVDLWVDWLALWSVGHWVFR